MANCEPADRCCVCWPIKCGMLVCAIVHMLYMFLYAVIYTGAVFGENITAGNVVAAITVHSLILLPQAVFSAMWLWKDSTFNRVWFRRVFLVNFGWLCLGLIITTGALLF